MYASRDTDSPAIKIVIVGMIPAYKDGNVAGETTEVPVSHVRYFLTKVDVTVFRGFGTSI